MHAWRIDALDHRAGIAFVSWRGETLFESPDLENAPAFYVAVPTFAAIPLAHRAIALGAERRGFQVGLIADGAEVPFDSLADVSDFVRRLYLTSAGSGPRGGGAPTVPEPGPEPRPGPGSEPDGEDLASPRSELTDAAGRFAERAFDLPVGQAREVKWPPQAYFVDRKLMEVGRAPILHGAMILLAELLARYRGATDAERLDRWSRAARRLVETIARLELVPWLAQGAPSARLHAACNAFLNASRGWDSDSSYRWAVWAALVHMQTPFRNGYRAEEELLLWAGARPGAEPLEDLASWPLPLELAKAISAPDPARASVADLLSAVLGAPELMRAAPEVEAVLSFAAARVVAHEGAAYVGGGAFRLDEVDQPMAIARHAGLAASAGAWLAENLPARVFAAPLEQMIRSPLAEAAIA